MEFEFDDNKSKRNKIKHGIDFIEAQVLWDDPDLIENIRIISVRRARKEEVEIYESS